MRVAHRRPRTYPRRMDDRLLEAFVALAEERHFRKAAERLFVTQPALSRRIQRLETEVGVRLVERGPGGVSLTAAGEAFLTGVRQILVQVEQARRSAHRAARGETGQLTLGFVDPAMYSALPPILRAYRAQRPDVELILRETPSHRQADALLRGTLDVAFSGIQPDGMRSETVANDAIVLALPARHALAGASALPLRAVADDPFVFPSRVHEPGLFDRLVGLCRAAGFSPQIVQQAERLSSILGLVAGGLGVAFVPQSVQRGSGFRDLAFARIEDATPPVTLRMIWRADRASPTLQQFTALALEVSRAG